VSLKYLRVFVKIINSGESNVVVMHKTE